MSDLAFDRQRSSPTLASKLLSFVLHRAARRIIKDVPHGSIKVILPSGRVGYVGNPKNAGPKATLKLNNFNLIIEAARRGTVGFAAAYMNKDIECDDLLAVFKFFLKNRDHLSAVKPGFFHRAAKDMAYHISRRNTREGSKKNIAEHYDLGNEFYDLWLDETMIYSSAYFTKEDQDLTEAQWAKNHLVADMAGVKPGSDVLEIGCGWGAFAETVAKDYKANLRGITLSKEQLKYGLKRLSDKGLDEFSKLVIEDYRDTQGQFDHICSIEMIEAVGEDHWPTYFKTVHDRLKPGGTAAIQAIVIDEKDFEEYRSNVDFIQRYIFPGGMLLTDEVMREQGENVGLKLERQEMFGQSYAKTLAMWRDAFLANWDKIEQLGFDETFKRKWVYYLTYCEAGFAEEMIDVGVYQYRRTD